MWPFCCTVAASTEPEVSTPKPEPLVITEPGQMAQGARTHFGDSVSHAAATLELVNWVTFTTTAEPLLVTTHGWWQLCGRPSSRTDHGFTTSRSSCERRAQDHRLGLNRRRRSKSTGAPNVEDHK